MLESDYVEKALEGLLTVWESANDFMRECDPFPLMSGVEAANSDKVSAATEGATKAAAAATGAGIGARVGGAIGGPAGAAAGAFVGGVAAHAAAGYANAKESSSNRGGGRHCH